MERHPWREQGPAVRSPNEAGSAGGAGGEREVLGPAPLLRVSLSTRETGDPRWHSCADSGRRLTPQCAVALSYLFWCLGRRQGYFGMGHGAVGIPAG